MLSQIDDLLESLGIWAFPISVPVIVATVWFLQPKHEWVAGVIRGLEFWPRRGRWLGFLYQAYRYIHRIEGQLWPLTFILWAAVAALGWLLSKFLGVVGNTARRSEEASTKGEAFGRKMV